MYITWCSLIPLLAIYLKKITHIHKKRLIKSLTFNKYLVHAVCLYCFKSWNNSSKREKSFMYLYLSEEHIDDKQVIGPWQLFIKHSVPFQFLGFTISQYKCVFCLRSGSFHYLQSSMCDTVYTCNWKWYVVMSNFW